MAYLRCDLLAFFSCQEELFIFPPFSACDTPGISSEPHPEEKLVSPKESWMDPTAINNYCVFKVQIIETRTHDITTGWGVEPGVGIPLPDISPLIRYDISIYLSHVLLSLDIM